MSMSYHPVRPYKDQPIVQRRRRRKNRPTDMERLQRDFWKHFDLEKFATDWRNGVGRRPTA